MASNTEKADARVLADLEAHGPSTPLEVQRRLGQQSAGRVWRVCLRLANVGQIEFDPTGRIASLTPIALGDQ